MYPNSVSTPLVVLQQEHLHQCLKNTGIKVGLWSTEHDVKKLPNPLFGPMSYLDTSFFDKLIDCVPLMVLYESAQTLASNVPLEVLNLSALLTSSIPEWFRLQQLREGFNSQMVTNFLERLTLCITFNTTDIPDHLPKWKFVDTEITCVDDIIHKLNDFK